VEIKYTENKKGDHVNRGGEGNNVNREEKRSYIKKIM